MPRPPAPRGGSAALERRRKRQGSLASTQHTPPWAPPAPATNTVLPSGVTASASMACGLGEVWSVEETQGVVQLLGEVRATDPPPLALPGSQPSTASASTRRSPPLWRLARMLAVER